MALGRLLWVSLLMSVMAGLCMAQDGAAGAPDDKPAATGQDKKPEDTAPPGVTVEVLPEPGPAQPGSGATQPGAPPGLGQAGDPAAAQGGPDEPKITLAYDGVELSEVLADMQKQLKVLIVCNEERLLKTKVYLHMTVRKSRALLIVATRVFRMPLPAHILCKAEEIIKDGEPVKVLGNPLLNLKLEDAVLKDALAYLTKKAEVGAGVTAALADKKLSFEAKSTRMDVAMADLAKVAEAELTTGYVLHEVDMEAGLDELEKMSDEQLEKLFSDALKQGQLNRGLSGEELDPNAMQGSMAEGMKMFKDLDPAERRAIVERAVNAINRFNGILQRLSPATRSGLKGMVQPYLGMAMGGYFSLDPQSRAELAPIMKSLGQLQW